MFPESFLTNLVSLHWIWQSTLCIGTGLLGSFLLRQRPTRAHQVLFWSMTAAIILPLPSALVKHYNLGLLQPEPAKTVSVSTPIPDPTPVASVEWTLPTAMPEYQNGVPAIPRQAPYEYTSIIAENYDTKLTEETFSATLTDVTIAESAPPIPTVPPIGKNSIPWTFWAIGGWILITAILVSRLLLYFFRGMQLVHKSQSIDAPCIVQALQRAKSKLQIRQPVRIFQSCRIKTPVIWCWFSCPILLIPEKADQSSKKIDWISVFCHELAHWKRRDHWCCLLAELLVCIFWPNPLVWWAKQRLIRLSEQACDDWVVTAGQSKTDYADSLLNLVPQGRITLVPTVIGGKKEMKNRIKRIIQDRADNPRISSRGTWLIGIMAIGLALGLALTQTRAAERDEDREPERERITKEHDEDRAHSEEREREHAERDLRDIEGREQDHDERAEHRHALAREMQELQERARDLEREMKELGDRNPEERRELQAELREIHEHMKNLEREMHSFDRERPERKEREHQEWQMIQDRMQLERLDLELRIREIQHELQGTNDDHLKRKKLENELDQLHENMRFLEQKAHAMEKERHAVADRDLHERELHQKELIIHRRNLQKKLEHMELELEETHNDEHARNLQRELVHIKAEIEKVEQHLHQERPNRERPERVEIERHLAELKKEIHRFAELGKHDQAEQLEREARAIMQHLKKQPDAPRPPRQPEIPHYESRPDLERQIHEMRGQVSEMRQEMKEIRGLLRELLDQKRDR